MKTVFTTSLLASGAYAFPWVVNQPGVDSSMLRPRQQPADGAGAEATCPFNPNHVPAPLVTAQFPYNNARNGRPGDGRGGFLVPDPNDPDHQFIAPTAQDIRGPCPGLNTAANHGFLARDGIVTFNELVDAQQNVYNVGHDLAQLLAVLGLTLTDGDPVTQKLSLACDATSRTSFNPALTGSQPGLSGHNKFEADASLTRNDFFTHNGDNFRFNRTLFDRMVATTGGNFDIQGMAKYRQQRFQESKAENANFFFGPLTLLLYGAASFLYELFPSGTRGYAPDLATISSFFLEERLPPNWTNRLTPYTNRDVGREIIAMYALSPVPFGFNTAPGSYNFVPNGPIFKDGMLTSVDPYVFSCAMYQLATGQIPSWLNGIVTPTVEGIAFAATKLDPMFKNLGCPIALT